MITAEFEELLPGRYLIAQEAVPVHTKPDLGDPCSFLPEGLVLNISQVKNIYGVQWGELQSEGWIRMKDKNGKAAAKRIDAVPGWYKIIDPFTIIQIDADENSAKIGGIELNQDVEVIEVREVGNYIRGLLEMGGWINLVSKRNGHIFARALQPGEERPKTKIVARDSQRWQKDSDVSLCGNCQRVFTLQRRKHHCRFCGQIFCDSCCPVRSQSSPDVAGLRCCDACLVILDISTASGSSPYTLHQGWLMKRGWYVKSWKRRWFVLWSNGILDYYTNEDLGELKGTLDVTSQCVRPSDAKPFGFSIICSTQAGAREWFFAAMNEEEKQQWVEALQETQISSRDTDLDGHTLVRSISDILTDHFHEDRQKREPMVRSNTSAHFHPIEIEQAMRQAPISPEMPLEATNSELDLMDRMTTTEDVQFVDEVLDNMSKTRPRVKRSVLDGREYRHSETNLFDGRDRNRHQVLAGEILTKSKFDIMDSASDTSESDSLNALPSMSFINKSAPPLADPEFTGLPSENEIDLMSPLKTVNTIPSMSFIQNTAPPLGDPEFDGMPLGDFDHDIDDIVMVQPRPDVISLSNSSSPQESSESCQVLQRQDDEDVLLSKTDSLVSVNLNDPIQAEVIENDVVLLNASEKNAPKDDIILESDSSEKKELVKVDSTKEEDRPKPVRKRSRRLASEDIGSNDVPVGSPPKASPMRAEEEPLPKRRSRRLASEDLLNQYKTSPDLNLQEESFQRRSRRLASEDLLNQEKEPDLSLQEVESPPPAMMQKHVSDDGLNDIEIASSEISVDYEESSYGSAFSPDAASGGASISFPGSDEDLPVGSEQSIGGASIQTDPSVSLPSTPQTIVTDDAPPTIVTNYNPPTVVTKDAPALPSDPSVGGAEMSPDLKGKSPYLDGDSFEKLSSTDRRRRLAGGSSFFIENNLPEVQKAVPTKSSIRVRRDASEFLKEADLDPNVQLPELPQMKKLRVKKTVSFALPSPSSPKKSTKSKVSSLLSKFENRNLNSQEIKKVDARKVMARKNSRGLASTARAEALKRLNQRMGGEKTPSFGKHESEIFTALSGKASSLKEKFDKKSSQDSELEKIKNPSFDKHQSEVFTSLEGKASSMREKFQKRDAKLPNCKRCQKPIYRGDDRKHIGHDIWHASCYAEEQREKLATRLRTLSQRQCNIISDIASREQAIKLFNAQRTRGKSISVCPGCRQTVFLAERGVLFHRAYFHPRCFRCCQCDQILRSDEYWARDHEPWCRKCYMKAFKEEMQAVRYDQNDFDYNPSSPLMFYSNNTLDFIFVWTRERKVMYSTMKIQNHKNIIAHFWRVNGEDIEIVPEEELIDFDAFKEWKVPRRQRSILTSDDDLQEFTDALTKDGPSFGMITYIYQKEEYGQIFDHLILFTWIPEDSEKVDKILYGTARGKLCDLFNFNFSVLVETKEELTREGLLKSLANKKNKR